MGGEAASRSPQGWRRARRAPPPPEPCAPAGPKRSEGWRSPYARLGRCLEVSFRRPTGGCVRVALTCMPGRSIRSGMHRERGRHRRRRPLAGSVSEANSPRSPQAARPSSVDRASHHRNESSGPDRFISVVGRTGWERRIGWDDRTGRHPDLSPSCRPGAQHGAILRDSGRAHPVRMVGRRARLGSHRSVRAPAPRPLRRRRSGGRGGRQAAAKQAEAGLWSWVTSASEHAQREAGRSIRPASRALRWRRLL